MSLSYLYYFWKTNLYHHNIVITNHLTRQGFTRLLNGMNLILEQISVKIDSV